MAQISVRAIYLGSTVLGIVAGLLYTPSTWGPHTLPPGRDNKPRDSAMTPKLQQFSYVRGGVLQRELSKRDLRYNPVTLADEEALSVQEVFASEPRDDSFAPVLEGHINASYRYALDVLKLGVKVDSITVECRTLSCYTKIIATDPSDAEMVYQSLSRLALGPIHSPSIGTGDESNTVIDYVVFEPDIREQKARDWFRTEALDSNLEVIRQLMDRPRQ